MKTPVRNPRKSSYAIQRASLWRRGFRCCYYCEMRLTLTRGCANSMTLDHKIPLAKGGRNKPENYVAACAPCNNAKGALDLADFYRQRRLAERAARRGEDQEQPGA